MILINEIIFAKKLFDYKSKKWQKERQGKRVQHMNCRGAFRFFDGFLRMHMGNTFSVLMTTPLPGSEMTIFCRFGVVQHLDWVRLTPSFVSQETNNKYVFECIELYCIEFEFDDLNLNAR